MNPLISIIIPTYNRGHLIGETLDSVLRQTYNNWECLIIDDGSEDNSEEIVNALNDQRLIYYYKNHGERSSARNYGLERAQGKYIQFLDSDDLLHKKKLEISVFEAEKNYTKEKIIILSNFQVLMDSSNITSNPYCEINENLLNYKDILYKWDDIFTIPIHCGLFDCRLFEEFKFPTYINYKEDWLMWLSLFQQDVKFYFIDEPLAFYRIRKSISQEEKVSNIKKEMRVLQYLGEFIPAKDCADFYFYTIEKKYNQILQLQRSLNNHKKTRTYKFSRVLNNLITHFRDKYQQ
ncbi:glycosyltransferase family 2 protein [Gramella sp. AN32]|uniref:Glycosyltransferase family 2 protein n=1 Tax=Christiangramia antarctica TaxID=2058158 RepID=A0ABW5X7L6_9FLAO|nr:glycosyltransferase family 2 protein [Gramella sp. AN32]MCM4154703.1 glycosyltransferase family 2 protein [Gramella sp. AN32]